MWKYCLYLLALCPHILFGQPLTLDTTFVPTFDFMTPPTPPEGYVLLEDGQGRIYLGGRLGLNGTAKGIIRMYPDGTWDQSFKVSGQWGIDGVSDLLMIGDTLLVHDDFLFPLSTSGAYLGNLFPKDKVCSVYSPMELDDGRILIGGTGCKFDSIPVPYNRLRLMRLHRDGTLDSSFVHDVNHAVMSLMRYDDTRILVYGRYITLYDSIPVNQLFRIDTAGVLDTTFHSIFTSNGHPTYVQPDGKIMIGGGFRISGHPDPLSLVRLMPDGSLDPSFHNFAGADSSWGASGVVYPLDDGGYLVGGFFDSWQGYPRGNIVKIDSSGVIDPNYFNGTGADSTSKFYPVISDIIQGQSGDFYVTGLFNRYDGRIVDPVIRLRGFQSVSNDPLLPSISATLYPNPAQDRAILTVSELPLRSVCTLVIHDAVGRECHRQALSGTRAEIDLEGWESGVYLATLETEAGALWHGKLVVGR
ncbi:T9SS type A sorting domain-containing protein [Pontibacter sp. G13]|uniref:T9SS type A sorting domain-containing protein n=1 Tax=Pontibacter sp. G13 TaxID=3074898 RepID=UPI00288ADA41|nr:T9SS type A sorting domain-containing protein [Pontibacter sp. G13]WNJ16661.1 T9SS type A sorting domain-containing protein [Pontibacter sp. G13]